MKTILIAFLLSLATVATGHEWTEKKTKEEQKAQIACLIRNQRQIADYLTCRKRCLYREKSNKNYQCVCADLNNNLVFCG